MLTGLLVMPPQGRTEPPSPLDSYRNLEYRPTMENFNKGWQERVLVEFKIVNSAGLGALRTGLKDRNPFVRAIAARALGPRKGARHYERRHRQNGPLPVSSVQDDFTLLSWKGT
jgi:hypothetical protein